MNSIYLPEFANIFILKNMALEAMVSSSHITALHAMQKEKQEVCRERSVWREGGRWGLGKED